MPHQDKHDKQLEHHAEVERKVIHLMLKSRSVIAELLEEGYTAEHFDGLHTNLVNAIIEYYQESKGKRVLPREAYADWFVRHHRKADLVTNLTVYDRCFLAVYAEPNEFGQIKKEWLNVMVARRLHHNLLLPLEEDIKNKGYAEAVFRLHAKATELLALTETRKVKLTGADEVTPTKVEWLWRGRIPLGKTTILSGEGGVGKGALITDIMARVSNGTPMPFAGDVVKGKTLIMSSEDETSDTLVPRLIAAGARLENCMIIDSRHQDHISLDTDLDLLRSALMDNPDIRLVVIDPISAYTGKVRDEELPLRNFLRPIELLAQETNCAIVMIKHYKKGTAKAKEKTSGSVAWVNAGRVALGVSQDNDDDDLKHLYVIKGNLTRTVKSVEFRTLPSDYDPEIVRIEWGNETDHKPDDFTADGRSGETTKVDRAGEWLTETLSVGPMPSNQIFERGEALGFSKKTLYRAKDSLGVKASRQGFGEQGFFTWSLDRGAHLSVSPGDNGKW